MNAEEFRTLTDLYSADLSRWPQDRVRAALDVMTQDGAARAYFDRALALDAALREYTPARMDLSALEDRICAAVTQRDGGILPAFFARPLAFFAPGGGLVMALLLGFFMGAQPDLSDTYLSAVHAPEQVAAADDAMISEEGDF